MSPSLCTCELLSELLTEACRSSTRAGLTSHASATSFEPLDELEGEVARAAFSLPPFFEPDFEPDFEIDFELDFELEVGPPLTVLTFACAPVDLARWRAKPSVNSTPPTCASSIKT